MATLLNRIKHFVAKPLQQAAREQRNYLADDASRGLDVRVCVVLISSTLMLVMQSYLFRAGNTAWVLDLIEMTLPTADAEAVTAKLTSTDNAQLFGLLYWALGQILIYVVIPVLMIKCVLRDRLRDYGVKFKGMFDAWSAYVIMAALMLPCVWVVSFQDGFLQTYPFYRVAEGESLWPRFFVWQLFYFLQFVSLEFFFRGYMLHGTRRRFGGYSILVMMIPYCMIHFGKPWAETCGAIAAGIVLGLMSLKTRSIWMGAMLHISVALTMDVAALWQTGRLFAGK